MGSETPRRKLTAILAADVVGYSRLMASDEEGTIRRLQTYREIIDGLIATDGGRVFGTAGDSVIAEFPSPVMAVRCAVEVQRRLAVRNSELVEDRRMRFRIGIHLGDVVVQGDDLLGDGVNVAARLEAMAEPGGVCVSQDVHHHVKDKLALTYDDLGAQSVKNIPASVHVYRVSPALDAATGVAPAPASSRTVGLAIGLALLAGLIAVAFAFFRSESGPAVDTIAVLPFADMSSEGDQQYFAEGMAEELTHSLANVEGLQVAARTSAFAFRGKQQDVRTIGRELGVGAVLEGSVRKAGDRLRIAVQLIEVSGGMHLWSETFDGDVTDVFDVQDAIARAVVSALELRFSPAGHRSIVERRTSSVRAYELYLLARFFSNKREEEGLRTAIEHFQQALAVDHAYALAYAGMSEAYAALWDYGYDLRPELLEKATHAAVKALELDPGIAEAHASLGHLRLLERDWDGAESAYRHAIELDGNYAPAHRWYAELLSMRGRVDESLAEARKSVEIEPLSPVANFVVGHIAILTGDLEMAIHRLGTTLELSPGYGLARTILAHAYLRAGMDRKAVEAYAAHDLPQDVRDAVRRAYLDGGKDAFLRKLVELAESSSPKPCGGRAYQTAVLLAYVKETDRTFACLADAMARREQAVAYAVVDPTFDYLRSDPRYSEFVAQMGLGPGS